MTRITSADHVLLLLRERLARSGGDRTVQSRGAATARSPTRPLERLRAMTALDRLGEEDRRRAIIQGLLTEELGDAIGNDPGFQTVLSKVVRIIGEMPGGPDLIDQAHAALRADRGPD